MSTSETKIELVTEAIEALVLASVVGHGDPTTNHYNIMEARRVLKGCLKEFLIPTLRIVTERERRVGVMSVIDRKLTEPAREGHKSYCTSDRCHCGPQ